MSSHKESTGQTSNSKNYAQDIFGGISESAARIDTGGNFLSVNNNYAANYGYVPEEMTSLHWLDTVYEADREVAEQAYQKMLDQGRAEAELRAYRKNNAVFYTKVVLVKGLFSDNSVVSHFCFMCDVTDQKLSVSSLEKAESYHFQKYENILNNLPGIFFHFVAKPKWHFEFLSHDGKEIPWLAYREGEKNPVQFFIRSVYPEDIPIIKNFMRDKTVRKDGRYQLEYRMIGAEGVVHWVKNKGRLNYDNDGNVESIDGMLIDITERKIVEQNFQSKTRALKVLNDCNYAITRIQEETALLKYICEIVVSSGGYRFSWAGYANQKNKTVEPIASAGYENNYLDSTFSWDGEPEGCGQTGLCIKTNTPYICRNIETDPHFEPWRQAALERGYLSSVALPLTKDLGVYGALMIYADKADYFDKDEVELLTNLAANVSYAIRSIRINRHKKNAEAILAANEKKYRLLVEQSGTIVWECSVPEYEFTYVSVAAEVILGYPVERWYEPGFWETSIHPDERDKCHNICITETEKGRDHNIEYRFRKQDGTYIWINDVVRIVRGDDGKITGLRGVMIDITARKTAEQALYKSEERFSLAMRGASDGLWDWNMELNEIYFSPRWKSMLGYEENQLADELETFWDLLHPDDLEKTTECINQYINDETNNYSTEFRLRHKDGHYMDILSRGFGVRDKQGNLVRLVGTNIDISARKFAEKELKRNEEKLRRYYDSGLIAMAITNPAGNWLDFNDTLCDLTGYSREEMLNKTWLDITHPEDMGVDLDLFKRLSDAELSNYSIQKRYVKKNGELVNVKLNVSCVRDKEGAIDSYVYLVQDISESYRLSEQLSYQAKHDSLTGLVNRIEFERRLQHAIELIQSTKNRHALCYIDLDQFKIINDTCGHLAGDELLRQLSMLLNARVRKNDTLARLGGDEFGLLMEDCDLIHAHRVADNLRSTVEEFRFVWQEKKFTIGASIGLVPITTENGNLHDILSAADAACYAAKDAGRNRVHVYSDDDRVVSDRRGEMQWANKIDQALHENLFKMYYQKILPIHASAEAGEHYELLIRMVAEDGKVIPPGAFLPAAERYGLSTKIDRWVIEYAFSWFARHPEKLEKLNLCAINLSGQSMGNQEFMAFLETLLAASVVPPQKICFEITETSAVADLSNAIRFINKMREKGCRFSLDDFGSGVSSFGYLKNLPVDFLKIDGSFVRDILSDEIDLAMVKSINEIGQIMGKKTIAEFVESEEILQKLKGLGVDYAQGYRIGKPEPLG